MIRRALLLLLPVLYLCSSMDALAQAKQGKKVYRWIDENGQVHYGNAIPPQYSRQDREVLNDQGVAVRKIEGQVTEAEARDQAEAAKQAREAAQLRHRDNVLLASYLSVQEIEMLRDRRVGILNDQITVQTQSLADLKQKLTKLMQQSAKYAPRNRSPGAHPLPENLSEDIARTGTDIRTAQANLDKKRVERQTLLDQFAADIRRFKELKGIKDPVSPVSTAAPAKPAASATTKGSTAPGKP